MSTQLAEEREYDEIMTELQNESLETLGVTEEEFAEMSLPEIKRRVEEQSAADSSFIRNLLE